MVSGNSQDLLDARITGRDGPSFSLRNRAQRAVFMLVWTLLASWTPPPLHAWRCALLRMFGARIGKGVRIYGSTRVWLPANLTLGDGTIIGPQVNLYNQGAINIGANSVISQNSHICASSHDVTDPNFQLVLRPIHIGDDVWVAADAFVGPGVTIGRGAVLGARGAVFRDMAPWTIHGGNPATFLKPREMR